MNEGHIYVATTCSLVPRPHPMVLSRSHDMRVVSFWNETAVWDLDHGLSLTFYARDVKEGNTPRL